MRRVVDQMSDCCRCLAIRVQGLGRGEPAVIVLIGSTSVKIVVVDHLGLLMSSVAVEVEVEVEGRVDKEVLDGARSTGISHNYCGECWSTKMSVG